MALTFTVHFEPLGYAVQFKLFRCVEEVQGQIFLEVVPMINLGFLAYCCLATSRRSVWCGNVTITARARVVIKEC